MLAVALDAEAAALDNPAIAGRILAARGRAVLARRRNRRSALDQPADVASMSLSQSSLEITRRHEGMLEFATLGSGNHFIEPQADGDKRLWLLVRGGSRAIGPAIRDRYPARAQPVGQGARRAGDSPRGP